MGQVTKYQSGSQRRRTMWFLLPGVGGLGACGTLYGLHSITNATSIYVAHTLHGEHIFVAYELLNGMNISASFAQAFTKGQRVQHVNNVYSTNTCTESFRQLRLLRCLTYETTGLQGLTGGMSGHHCPTCSTTNLRSTMAQQWACYPLA